jgi:hypothetical protein
MKAQGKREARRPGLPRAREEQGLKGRNNADQLRPFRAGIVLKICYPGATRFALAPGYHIPRRWRSVLTFVVCTLLKSIRQEK